MISKYGVFCEVIETGHFTRAAENLGYSQSAVSQTVKSLENELGFILIDRRKGGICLTSDGESLYPYIKALYLADKALERKTKEMNGLSKSVVTIGTFTGVSRNFLPPIMKSFKLKYPGVEFVLQQGEYTSIAEWIKEGSIDFGFINMSDEFGLEQKKLYDEPMLAVLPPEHPLVKKNEVCLVDFSSEPFILLDEGKRSVPGAYFEKYGIKIKPAYKVYDDYTILSMVKQNIGVSIMYESVLKGFESGLALRQIKEKPKRTVAIAWHNSNTLSKAARMFIKHIESSLCINPALM